MINKRKNTEQLKQISRYEEIINDKEKIISLLEKQINYLENLYSIKTTFKSIKMLQNEKIESLEKQKK